MQPAREPGVRDWAAAALVFYTSAVVLVIEILAGRLVAPYVGVSLETYTGIIGTVLAGIAVGSAIGGRTADRHDPRPLLGPLLMAAGGAAFVILPIIAAFGPGIADAGGGAAGVVVLAVTAFVLPTAILSAVPPMVAKLRLHSTRETGSVVGYLSAAGTAGALVGTFATGFFFVAAWPTRPIVAGVGVSLVVAGIVVSLALRRRPRLSVVAALVLLAVLVQAVPSPCDRETRYYCASIDVDPQRASGRTLVLDDLRHSYVDLDDPTHLEFRYARLFEVFIDAHFGTVPLDALHIGGGGFTFPRWLEATRPGSTSTVLELDPRIVDLARDELELQTGPRLRVRTGDARMNILDEPDDAHDLVIGDAFGGRSVPWHLTTVEMLREIRRTLRPDGMYVLNMIDADRARLIRGQAAGLARVFDHVAVVLPPNGPHGNYVLVASDAVIDPGDVPPADGRVLIDAAVTRFIDGARALTDDFAPADQLIARV